MKCVTCGKPFKDGELLIPLFPFTEHLDRLGFVTHQAKVFIHYKHVAELYRPLAGNRVTK